jgi:septal ring factor EnvC (AmiA/AmiB activator)
MSDDPTRRLAATRPVVAERSVAYVHSDEEYWRQYLYERLRSLTTAVTLVAIVAVAALAVGLWSILGDQGDGVSTDRVSRLEERVAALDARLRQRPAANDLGAVRERQQAMEQALRTLERQAQEPDEDTAAVIEAVDATQQSVAQLEQRIAALEQAGP